jgi:hypothetical protein
LTIANLYGDVTLVDAQELQQVLVSNYSMIAGKSSYVGTPGETFRVEIDLTFQACPCVKQVTAVKSLTPGFAVVGTTPSLPVRFGGQGGDYYEASFSVEVSTPATPYNGSLTLVANVE